MSNNNQKGDFMSIQKVFKCENCDAAGKVVIKGNDLSVRDIVCCPVCGASIWDEDDENDDE